LARENKLPARLDSGSGGEYKSLNFSKHSIGRFTLH
jgi:hypothetical protein